MAITPLPPYYHMKGTNEDGQISSEYNLYNDQLWQSLKEIVEQLDVLIGYAANGWLIPSKTTAQITALAANANGAILVYNTDLSKLQFKLPDNSVETITST